MEGFVGGILIRMIPIKQNLTKYNVYLTLIHGHQSCRKIQETRIHLQLFKNFFKCYTKRSQLFAFCGSLSFVYFSKSEDDEKHLKA